MFFHLNSGQVQDGVWNNDMCVYSQLKDVDYRQCCIEPTPYPIPEVRHQNSLYNEMYFFLHAGNFKTGGFSV